MAIISPGVVLPLCRRCRTRKQTARPTERAERAGWLAPPRHHHRRPRSANRRRAKANTWLGGRLAAARERPRIDEADSCGRLGAQPDGERPEPGRRRDTTTSLADRISDTFGRGRPSRPRSLLRPRIGSIIVIVVARRRPDRMNFVRRRNTAAHRFRRPAFCRLHTCATLASSCRTQCKALKFVPAPQQPHRRPHSNNLMIMRQEVQSNTTQIVSDDSRKTHGLDSNPQKANQPIRLASRVPDGRHFRATPESKVNGPAACTTQSIGRSVDRRFHAHTSSDACCSWRGLFSPGDHVSFASPGTASQPPVH
jgi:hypothetical protein